MTPEERLAKFKMAKQKAEEEKNKHSSFPKEEVPDFKVCVLNKDTPKIIRLIGNSPLMREIPSDPLIVKRSVCIDDNGNYTTVVLSDDRDHPINKLFRTIIGKYKYNKEDKTRIYDNKGIPSFERFIHNGKDPKDCKASEKGMLPDTYYMFNCIDKTDDWCKKNKHTKLLCWDSNEKEVNGEKRTYYTYGIKSSLYNNIFDVLCTKLNRMYDQFDVVVKRLSKQLGNEWMTICNPEEKISIGNMGLNPEKVSLDYLSEEEENYEKYCLENIPFVTKPTSCGYFLSAFSKLIKQADIDFNKGEPKLYNEFVEWKAKEFEEIKKKNAEKEESEKTSEVVAESEDEEVVEVEETETVQTFDTMEDVAEEEDLPSEVEEPVVETPKKVMKVAKVAKFDPMNLIDKFPSITNMHEEDRKLIIGYDSQNDVFKYSTNDLATCPECGREIPDPWKSCVCGVRFE